MSLIRSQAFGGGGGGGILTGVGVQGTGVNSPLPAGSESGQSPSGANILPASTGSIYIQRRTTPDTRDVIWVATGQTSSSWTVAASSTVLTTDAGNPNGVVWGDRVGQFLADLNSSTGTVTTYVAAGNYSWYVV